MCKTYDAVITCLFADSDDPTASGLCHSLSSYRFILTLHFLWDVLTTLAHLNRHFQKRDLHPGDIMPKVRGTIS